MDQPTVGGDGQADVHHGGKDVHQHDTHSGEGQLPHVAQAVGPDGICFRRHISNTLLFVLS